MKTSAMLTILVAVLLAGLPARAEESTWLTDFRAARKLAAERNVPILANFAGSDWCGWCIRLDREVFAKTEFVKYASGNVVLFLADFPSRKKQSAELKKQNSDLAQKYGVRGFPTVLLLSANGDLLARTGYRKGGAEKYVEHVKRLVTEALKNEGAEAKKSS